MHKIINKKSIQKITAIIIIMIMCNFIMSGKVWAKTTWMSINEYIKLNIGATDIKQNVYDANTSPAVKKICSAWNVTSDQAIEILKNHADDKNTLAIVTETSDITVYRIDQVSIKLTEEEKSKYNIETDANGNASVDTTANGTGTTNGYREGANEGDSFGVLFGPLANLIQGIGDSVNRILQSLIIGEDTPVFYNSGVFSSEKVLKIVTDNPTVSGVETVEVVKDYIDIFTGKYGVPDIKLTPAEIFAGNVSALDANFFETRTDHNNELGGNGKSIIEQLKGTVSKWYVALRNIAIVGLLSVLLYIGIRIVISSSAGDKAKYKQFFVDWVVALCLIFFLHYIMAFTMTMSETITDVLSGDDSSQGRIKQVNIKLINEDGSTFVDEVPVEFSSNFTGVARIKADYASSSLRMGYSILYIALTVYTVYFAFVYLKRLLMLAFFTMIAPLVALSYPLDKIKDGKAQAFNYWFKEYMFYALLQPLHMLLYTVFVSSALSVAANNLLYAIVALAFIVPAEKIVKQMFGIKGNTESTLGGFAGGALASQAFSMLKKGPPPPKKGGEASNGTRGIRQAKNPNTPNALDTLGGSLMGENAAQTATAAGIGAAAGAAAAQNNEENDKPVSEMTLDEIAAMQEQNGQLEAPKGKDMSSDEIAAMQEQNGQLEAGNTTSEQKGKSEPEQTAGNKDNQPAQQDQCAAIRNNNKFDATRRRISNNFKTAAHERYVRAGGAKGIALSAGKAGVRLGARAFTTAGMGALGLGIGIVGGDMSDTLKGLGAGLTAGYATGGRIIKSAGNAGNSALGNFTKDVLYGDERAKNDYIKSYMAKPEVKNKIMDKNPKISVKDLNNRMRQEAEMSYDTGIADVKTVSAAVDMERTLEAENVKGRDNHSMAVALAKLGENYDKSTFNDSAKRARAQQSLQQKFEKRLNEAEIAEATRRADEEIKNKKAQGKIKGTIKAEERQEMIRMKTSEMANAKAQKTLDYIEKMKK